MDLLKKMAEKQRLEDERDYVERVNHRCHPCEFATWVGSRYYCPFQTCFRDDAYYKRWNHLRMMRSVMQSGKADRA